MANDWRSEKVERYLYLDVAGIESLYAQTVDHVEVERTKTQTKEKKNRKFGEGVIGFWGVGKLKGGVDAADGDSSAVSTRMELSTEQKLRIVLNHLLQKGTPSLFSDLCLAAAFTKEQKEAVFIDVKIEIDAPQFYKENGVESVNEEKVLLFERDTDCTDNYKYEDGYYKQPKLPIVMSASLEKFPNCRSGRMTMTGHEAIFLRGHRGRALPLHVFGQLLSLPLFFQIKPYAIGF